jgi:Uma2 family endonuclease
MITSLDQLDFDKTYSYADYLTWQFDGFVELVKGKIMPMSAPSRLHQKAVSKLDRRIGNFIENNHLECEIYVSPFDVRLLKNPDEILENRLAKTDKEIYSVFQPDICVVCDLEKLDDKGCNGAPNLIIEIVSEKSAANAQKDTKDKYEIYEANGVLEYWLARPLEKTVQRFLLNLSTSKYEAAGFFRLNESVPCSVLTGFEIEVNDLFK